jgi:hypothetical protein
VVESVTHGSTGFICETEDDVVAAVDRIPGLSRAACRAEFDPALPPSTTDNAGRMASA